MNDNSIDYSKVTYLAFKVASHYLYDQDSAKDIAQLTAIECFLNAEKLQSDSLSSWIYTVAKNKSLSYIKSKSKQKTLVGKKVESHIDEDQLTPIELEELINNTPNKVVPIKKKQLLKEVLIHQYDFKKLSKKHGLSYHTFRDKIYRIQQEILLYHRIIRDTKRSPSVPGTKLHENIKNFCIKLKNYLENEDVSIFSEYLIDQDTKKILQYLEIERIVNYQLLLKGKAIYELFFAFFNSKNVLGGVKLSIIVQNSKLIICSAPKIPKKVFEFDISKMPESLRAQLQPGPDGIPKISKEEFLKKLQDCKNGSSLIYEENKDN
jgi:DNA-directed RNA polymerase specialized sigma24 family protein